MSSTLRPTTGGSRVSAAYAPRRSAHVHTSFYNCFLLVALLLGAIAPVRAQSLQVTTANNTIVNQGDTLWIDQTPLMPSLTLAVTGGETSCDTLSYTITLNWTAATGQQTNAQLSNQFACNLSQMVDWLHTVGYAGGNTIIQYSGMDSCGNVLLSGTLSFSIMGKNPSNSSVATLISSSPWFWLNMIAWESSAYPAKQYHQFDGNGNPFNCNCPNGIGLTQLDPYAGGTFPSGAEDFWAWPTNEVDGYNILASYNTPATNAWNNEFNQMTQTTGGNPVYPPTTTIQPNCTFVYPVTNGNHSYIDANWIKMYNNGPGLNGGVYNGAFIFWDPPTGTTAGFWDPEDNSQNYVHHVCQTNALLQ